VIELRSASNVLASLQYISFDFKQQQQQQQKIHAFFHAGFKFNHSMQWQA
jgi:hypothetical protein